MPCHAESRPSQAANRQNKQCRVNAKTRLVIIAEYLPSISRLQSIGNLQGYTSIPAKTATASNGKQSRRTHYTFHSDDITTRDMFAPVAIGSIALLQCRKLRRVRGAVSFVVLAYLASRRQTCRTWEGYPSFRALFRRCIPWARHDRNL